MNNKQENIIRLGLKILIIAAGVFALIGAIGALASIGKIIKGFSSISGGSTSSLESLSAASSLIKFYPMLDLARFGGFAGFLLSIVLAAVAVFSRSSDKSHSLIITASSVLGFVGCFLTSTSAMYNSVMSSATSVMGSILSSGSRDTNTLVYQIIKKIFTPMRVGCIFIIISAAVAVILAMTAIIKPAMDEKGYIKVDQPYGQQNPGQAYPNQQNLGQAYPNHQNLGQAYPNQQNFGQAYPNQHNFGQAPTNEQQNLNDLDRQ